MSDLDTLGRCVGDPARFLREHWGHRPHLQRSTELAEVLTLAHVDELLTDAALRTPAFRLVRDGQTLDPATYTRTARIGSKPVSDLADVGRVHALVADGATLVLQGLHRYWRPVADLCRALSAELTHPVQANAYVTPPGSQGLQVHADRHDVFAVQTHGRKRWVLYTDGDEPDADLELAPGDCLYLPKGHRHAAQAIDRASVHLTIGVRTVTWADVVSRVVAEAMRDPILHEPLPAGFARAPDRLVEDAIRRLKTAADILVTADPAPALDALADRATRSLPPDARGQLGEILDPEPVDDRTVVRRRQGTLCTLRRVDNTLEVVLADRTLRMPAAVEPAVRMLLERDRVTPDDLAGHLDEAGRVTLVRRLLREGLLQRDD